MHRSPIAIVVAIGMCVRGCITQKINEIVSPAMALFVLTRLRRLLLALLAVCAPLVASAQAPPTSDSPVVADNVTLAASANTTYPLGVLRRDYATGNGAPPMLFLPQTNTCGANGLISDGGTCVDGPDGNSWKAQPGPELDWREFGASVSNADNRPFAQAAFDAGYRLGLPIKICGSGFYKTSTLYLYNRPVVWCSHRTVLQRLGAGPVLAVSDAPGHTYPHAAMLNLQLIRPTIDMNAALMTSAGGAGIVASATDNWEIDDPNVWNIPTMATPAPAVAGAPIGTFAYTDADGTGWAENGGIVLLGGPEQNIENGRIIAGFASNFALDADGYPLNGNCGPIRGAAGLVLSVPSQRMGSSVPLPANGNNFYGSLYDCTSIGVRNDYPGANRFVNLDTTYSSLVGYALGTYGRYDLIVGGTPSGNSTIGITFMAEGLNGSPLFISAAGSGSPTTMAATLASKINGNTALARYGVTAGVWPGTPTIHIDYGDEFSASQAPGSDRPLNFALCDSRTLPPCQGVMTIRPYYTAGWNSLVGFASEDDGVAAVYLGANARGNIIELPQQVSGSHITVMHQHAGPSGSNMTLVNNNVNTFNAGTPKSSNFFIDCNNDPQPYLVSTGSGPVTGTFLGYSEGGTKCEFVDATPGGGWATHNFTLRTPGAGWGQITIRGRGSLPLATDFGDVTMRFMPLNNSTLSTGSDAGGDWR